MIASPSLSVIVLPTKGRVHVVRVHPGTRAPVIVNVIILDGHAVRMP